MQEKRVKQMNRWSLARVVGGAVACALWVGGCKSLEGFLPQKGAESAVAEQPDAPLVPVQVVPHGKPEGVSVTANGLRSAVLSWSNPIEPAYRYRIERAEAAEGPYAWIADVAPGKLSFTDGLVPSVRLKDSATYFYRMTAVLDKTGIVSEPTPPVKTTTAPPPVPPASIKVEATSSRAVTVTWPLSASEGVTSYRVERALADKPEAFEKAGEVREAKLVDGGTPASVLKDSTKYLYRVVAINRVEAQSAPSQSGDVTTLPPPAPPKQLAATANEVRCVPLKWEPSPEQDVVRYDVYQARAAEGPFAKIGEVQGRTTIRYTDGGGNPGSLEDEGTYYYRIRAVNNVTAESADSETVHAVTRAVPPEVQQVTAVSARPREVPLSWVVSADTSVMGYEVWRTLADADDWVQIARLTDRNSIRYTDRGGEKDGAKLGLLKDGTEYQYKVIAFNTANVRSSASEVVKAKTKVIPVPPAGVAASTQLAHTIRLTWQPNPEKDVNGYWVESAKKPTGSFRKLAVTHVSAGAALTAEEQELDSNVTRFYRVKALDREGLESLWSDVVEGHSKLIPSAPTGLSAKAESGMIRLTWQASPQADVTQYKVWVKKMLSWTLIGTANSTEYSVSLTDVPKATTIAVSAVDQDKLESEKSEPLKVDPNAL